MKQKQTSEMILKPAFVPFSGREVFYLIWKEFLAISFHVWLSEPTDIINILQEHFMDPGFTVTEVPYFPPYTLQFFA